MARPRNYHIQHITTTVPLEAKGCSDSQENRRLLYSQDAKVPYCVSNS
jgi:hypothetical protein